MTLTDFIFHKDGRFAQQIAQRRQDKHPQQAAHPVEELKARVIQAGYAGNGGQQRSDKRDKTALSIMPTGRVWRKR